MPISYVLINSEYGADEQIIKEVKEAVDSEPGIKYEIQGVYGIYDVVLKLTSDDAAHLRSVITNKVRKITKVQSTLTMVVIEEQGTS